MNEIKIKISDDFIRLDTLLKLAGITETGGQAKFIIQNGEVRLNGEICTMRGKKVYSGDKAEYKSITVTAE